jgi:hypothetical protein
MRNEELIYMEPNTLRVLGKRLTQFACGESVRCL